MAYSKIDMEVPDIERAYSNYSLPQVIAANTATLKNIKSKYGLPISKWSLAFDIPSGIITAFIATESGGNQFIVNKSFPDIKGLMQIAPAPVFDTVTRWKSEVSQPLPNEFISEVRLKIPELLKSGVKYDNNLKAKIVKLTASDANFNIMMGTAHLRWLLERFSTILGGGQLNKAMVAYNAGAYTKALKTSGGGADITPVDTAVLVANKQVPLESRNYLLKMFGIDGFLFLIYKKKVI